MTFHAWTRSWAYPLLAVGVVAGCGGSSNPAADKCYALRDEICRRLIDCTPGAAGMQAECQKEGDMVFNCPSIKSVSSTFDTCMGQLEAETCDALFSDTGGLPDACMGVLRTTSNATPGVLRSLPPAVDFSDFTSRADE